MDGRYEGITTITHESRGRMTDTPATKKAVKPQKITYPRLYNALEDIVDDAGLGMDDTIKNLYDALEAAIVKDARGK